MDALTELNEQLAQDIAGRAARYDGGKPYTNQVVTERDIRSYIREVEIDASESDIIQIVNRSNYLLDNKHEIIGFSHVDDRSHEEDAKWRAEVKVRGLVARRDRCIAQLDTLKKQEEYYNTENIVLKVKIADLTIEICKLEQQH